MIGKIKNIEKITPYCLKSLYFLARNQNAFFQLVRVILALKSGPGQMVVLQREKIPIQKRKYLRARKKSMGARNLGP